MKFKKFSEVKYEILAYTLIPIIVGGAIGIPHRGWVDIRHFLVEDQQWAIATIVWLFMMGIICLFAEANNQKTTRVKRIVGCAVVTLWVWGVTISGLFANQQPPIIQQHISIPADYHPCGKT